MNVYDFDKTIYNGDSTYDFYIYSLTHHPKVLLTVHKALFGAIKHYVFHKCTKTEFKEQMYTFLKYANAKQEVARFWDKKQHKIKKLYYNLKQDDDVIISASPTFLLEEICKRQNIKYLIASNVDINTGKYDGINCYGDEKVKRFYEVFSDGKINDFYSDSYSDSPLAKISQRAFLVTKENVTPW